MPPMSNVEVDPSLLAVIKSPGAPSAGPRTPPLPASLPGIDGFVASLAVVFQTLRRGVEHMTELREKHGDIYRIPFVGHPVVIVWDADEIH
jgi:hypothetical protein